MLCSLLHTAANVSEVYSAPIFSVEEYVAREKQFYTEGGTTRVVENKAMVAMQNEWDYIL
jgi:hypothetical protein